MCHKIFHLKSKRWLKHFIEQKVCIRRWSLSIVKNQLKGENHKSKETKFLQYKSAISKHWCNFDIDWIEDNFMTREPDFSRGFFNSILQVKQEKHFLRLLLLLEMQKTQVKYNSILQLQYWKIKKNSNISCFSSLASTVTAPGEVVATNAIVFQTKEPLHCQSKGYSDRIKNC